MHRVDSPEPTLMDAVRAPKVHDGRQERVFRWGFWIVFLLATLCAFAWKMVDLGAS